MANEPAVRTVRCRSWEEFCAAMRMADGAPLEPIYRGHARVDWPLVGPSERMAFAQAKEFHQRGVDVIASMGPAARGQYRYFRRLATCLPGVDLRGLSEIDIEALARHHGLCSNLVDWTLSPYVAAFFAFTTALDMANGGRLAAGTLSNAAVTLPSESVCVWRLSVIRDLWRDNEFEMLSSLSPVNYWQKAQQGLFTRLSHPTYVDITSYLEHRGLVDRLCRYIIPGGETGKALQDLELMNITFATLFPDLRGAVMQANVGATWRFLHAEPRSDDVR